MKALTIPKLEWQAIVLVPRLRTAVHHASTMQVDRTFKWTVLQWLHSSEKQLAFVAKRIAETVELTTIDEWNHVQSADNPAGGGKRGIAASAFLDTSWLKGPNFLRTSDWHLKPPDENLRKIRLNKLATDTKPSSELRRNYQHNASTLERRIYSSYEKILLNVAYVMRE